MRWSWSALWGHLWEERPQRLKLTLAVWLSLVPVFVITSSVALLNARQAVEGRLRQQLIWDAQQASEWLAFWSEQHLRELELLASYDMVRRFEGDKAGVLIDSVHRYFPHYSYGLISKTVGTVDRAGTLMTRVTPQQLQRMPAGVADSYANALQGISSSAPLLPPFSEEPCVASSVPVYSQGKTGTAAIGGVLSTCLTLENLGWVTGIDGLIESVSGDDHALPLIDLDQGKRRGYALLLVLEPGRLIELGLQNMHQPKSGEGIRHLRVKQVAKSDWSPIVRSVEMSREPTSFHRVRIAGIDYLAGVDRSKTGHTVVMVMDSDSAFSTVNGLFLWISVGTLCALLVSTLVLTRVTKEFSRPFHTVGGALARLSQGEFGDPLPEPNSDLGRLFGYVNQASRQLQLYLEDIRKHAVTDAQLKEARRIQADFLVKDLPNTDRAQVAALFQPAYEIGADWYDGFVIDGLTFVVVADVCDKGVPSALYMSVFRSLLRLSLFKEWEDTGDPEKTLQEAVGTVNQYMAATHGETGMFATVFAGAYNPECNALAYLIAGHEAPLVLRDRELTPLPLGGPAVGIFTWAQYKAGSCEMPPGSLLMAFSDGLPDARNPEGVGFGFSRIGEILREQVSSEWSAEKLVERLQQAVSSYMGDAEQFDDLTLLTLKVKALT